jgi:formylglycine-generating enzyme required for sulfatase activity
MKISRFIFVFVLGFTIHISAGCGKSKSQKAFMKTNAYPGSSLIADATFVEIAPGSFLMGSPDTEEGRFVNEGPQHDVILTKAFEVQATEVTQAQWVTVMGSNPSSWQRSRHCPEEFREIDGVGVCPDHPVEKVSWEDTQAFIQRLNQLGDGYRYRLPTEAEWEYIGRAGVSGPYADDLDLIAWYAETASFVTHPVATRQSNVFGLYDTIGNVWEWTADWYGLYAADPVTDPKGPESGKGRVMRGCSWNEEAVDCRTARRLGIRANERHPLIGFRLVRAK